MNIKRKLGALIAGSIVILFTGCGGETKKLQAENEALRTEIASLQARNTDADATRSAELKRRDSEASDVARLRGEVTQLRNAAKETDKLRAELQQLRNENQSLRGAVTAK